VKKKLNHDAISTNNICVFLRHLFYTSVSIDKQARSDSTISSFSIIKL